MADNNNNNNPQNPVGQILDENAIERLSRGKNVIKDISDILKKNSDNYKEVIEQARVFSKTLLEQQEEINKTGSEVEKNLTGKFDLYSRNLKSSIENLERFSTALKNELNESLRQNIILEEELKELKNSSDKIESERLKALKEKVDLMEQLFESTKNNKEILEAQAEVQKELEKLSKEGVVLDEKIISKIIRKQVALDEQSLVQSRLIELGLTLNAVNQKTAEQRQKEVEATLQANKLKQQALREEVALKDVEKERTSGLENLNEKIKDLTQNLTSASSWMGMFKSAAMAAASGATNLSDAISKGFTEAFSNPMVMLNLFLGVLKTIGTFFYKFMIAPAFEFDKTLAEVNKNTGGFRDEFEKIALIKQGPFSKTAIADLSVYGVQLKELGAAYTALGNKINGFNLMSDQQRLLLSKNAATMENLGLSASTYADMTSKFMGAIGKTADGTKDSINLLARDAIAAGRSVGEYTKEFQQLMPQLTAYGREATQLFKELNSLAGMTKGVMSTGDLMQFSEQFSNWDSAAESVSKLNAALGGTSLNIADLMTADPTERLMQIKRAFDESGQDFDKLNAGYKKLLAEAFGGDVSKAASFFKGSLADANAEMSKMAASEKELEERKKKSIAAQEKLTKAIDSMRIAFTPIIDIVTGLAELIAKVSENMNPIVTFLTVSIPLGFVAFKLASMAVAGVLRTAFTSVFSGIISQLSQIIGQLRVAKSEAVDLSQKVSDSSGGGGDGKDLDDLIPDDKTGGKNKKKGKPGKVAKLGAIMAITGLVGGLHSTYTSAKENSINRMNAAESPNAAAQAAAPASYEDGEEMIGPGQTKTLLVGGVPKAQWSAKDTFIGAGAVDPSKLPSTNNNVSVSQMTNMSRDFMQVSEINSQRYAEKLSAASRDVIIAKTESSEKMMSMFKESINESNKKPINVNVEVKDIVASIDGPSIQKISQKASNQTFEDMNSIV